MFVCKFTPNFVDLQYHSPKTTNYELSFLDLPSIQIDIYSIFRACTRYTLGPTLLGTQQAAGRNCNRAHQGQRVALGRCERGNNFYDFCYSDEFATAFLIKDGRFSNYTNCFAYWYSKRGEKHVVFKSEGKFNSYVQGLNVGIGKHNAAKVNKILECDKEGGSGLFENLHIRDARFITDNTHKSYIK